LIDLSQSLLPAVFAVTVHVHTIIESPLENLLESLLERAALERAALERAALREE